MPLLIIGALIVAVIWAAYHTPDPNKSGPADAGTLQPTNGVAAAGVIAAISPASSGGGRMLNNINLEGEFANREFAPQGGPVTFDSAYFHAQAIPTGMATHPLPSSSAPMIPVRADYETLKRGLKV